MHKQLQHISPINKTVYCYVSNTKPVFINHLKYIFNQNNPALALTMQIKLQMCCFLVSAQVTPPDKSAGRGQTEA